MTPLQKLTIERAELQNKVNSERYAEIRSDDPDADTRIREGRALRDQMEVLNKRIIEAINADDAANTSPESREWSDVSGRFDLGEMFTNVIEHRASSGAIAEVQSERGLGANAIPVELLMEHRAVTPGAGEVGQNQDSIEGYVFPASVAAFLGIPSPIVPVGDKTYPVLTSDPAAGTPAENAAQAETTGAFTAEVLTPKRIQASFFWSREDAGRMDGMGDALREALQGGIADKLDQQIMNGTKGLLNGTVLPNNNVAAATTFAGYISSLAMSRVDGQYAAELSDLRIVMGSPTYAHAGGVYRATESDRTALDRLAEITSGVRVSKHVPAVANHKQNAVVRLGNRRDMVAPVWGGVTLIPDEITKAGTGQIVLTAVMLFAVQLLRAGGFYKQQTQHQ